MFRGFSFCRQAQISDRVWTVNSVGDLQVACVIDWIEGCDQDCWRVPWSFHRSRVDEVVVRMKLPDVSHSTEIMFEEAWMVLEREPSKDHTRTIESLAKDTIEPNWL